MVRPVADAVEDAVADAVTGAVADALADAAAPHYVAFSGGRDSTVLLHAVHAHGGNAVAVHVNHGLHPEADRWQAHCAAQASRLGVAFVARKVTVSPRGSVEAAARAARYRVFTALLDAAPGSLLLAHHRHDQSETVLLRLLQGRGLYGMPAWRRLGRGRLLRPLLDVAPAALDAYARAYGLRWVTDPGNADLRLDRNLLRHRVLPELRRRFPRVDDALLEAARRQALGDELLREALPAGGAAPLPLDALPDHAPARAVTVLQRWLAAAGLPLPSRRALEEFLRQVRQSGRDAQPLLAVGGIELRVHQAALHVVEPVPALAERYPVAVPGVSRLPHGVLEVRPDPAGFLPVGPVTVRFRGGGERVLVGGHRRRLKQLLQAAGIPPWQRRALPLLFDDAGLLAVPGVAQRDAGGAGGGRFRVVWRRDPPDGVANDSQSAS